MLHLRNLLDEMVLEEESLKNSISQRTDKYRRELAILCEELSEPEYKVLWGKKTNTIIYSLTSNI